MRHDDVVDCLAYAVTEVVSGAGTPPRVYTELHHSPDVSAAVVGEHPLDDTRKPRPRA